MSAPKIKAVMFDIGGVCAGSPFQAILDYEREHAIPSGYINRCISASKPDGAWHRLERGEMAVDEAFFSQFGRDLQQDAIWTTCVEYHLKRRERSAGKGKGKAVSFSARPPALDIEALFWGMIGAAQVLDPHIMPALRALRASGRYIVAALSNTIPMPAGHPYARPAGKLSEEFDVYISSAHIGLRKPHAEIFEVSVEAISGHARRAARDLTRATPSGWADGVRPEEVLFLDDIRENCDAARQCGLQVIKVDLGHTERAVREMQRILGEELRGPSTARL